MRHLMRKRARSRDANLVKGSVEGVWLGKVQLVTETIVMLRRVEYYYNLLAFHFYLTVLALTSFLILYIAIDR